MGPFLEKLSLIAAFCSCRSSISSSTSFMNMSEKVGSAFGAAKNRVSASLSSHNISQVRILTHHPGLDPIKIILSIILHLLVVKR